MSVHSIWVQKNAKTDQKRYLILIMNPEDVSLHQEQLKQVTEALLSCSEGPRKEDLLGLKTSIEELLRLNNTESANNQEDEEFALFMSEMKKEGALIDHDNNKNINNESNEIEKMDVPENYKEESIPNNIEGAKCRAPHKHQWGVIAYHNAMICSLIENNDDEEIKVRVLFTNPTHKEMLPCPYYFDSECKFSDEKCHYSHGEIVPYSSLQEYIEPKFERICVGSCVLAKQSSKLWYRAVVKEIYENKYLVRLESTKKDIEVVLEHLFPLDNSESVDTDSASDANDVPYNDKEDVINASLMATPTSEALGNWEQYTRGIGSKLMAKMGYVVGTGLGKNGEGRIEPVTGVHLPTGKSLDHCMKLREHAGGDKDLFSVERKLKRIQKKQQKQREKAYEKEKKRVSGDEIFNLINKTLSEGDKIDGTNQKVIDRQRIKRETSRNLNVKNLQIADNIRKVERDLEKLRESLSRHTDTSSNIHLKLKDRLIFRQDQLKMYQTQAQMIRNELNLRNDKKKLTVF